MVKQEIENIEILKKKKEEEATKVSLSRVIIGFFRDALSFNILD